MSFLLQQGGTTPLVYVAVKAGRLDIVRFLVEECHVMLNSDQMVRDCSATGLCTRESRKRR